MKAVSIPTTVVILIASSSLCGLKAQAQQSSQPRQNIGAQSRSISPAKREVARKRNQQREMEIALALESLKKRNVKEGLAAFERAKEISSIHIPYDQLGDALEANGETEKAIWMYRQWVYRDRGRDWVEDGKSLTEMVKQATGNNWTSSRGIAPDVLMRYALLLSKTGRYAEACQVYEWGLIPFQSGIQEEQEERDFALNMTAETFNKPRFEAMALTLYGRSNIGTVIDGFLCGQDEEAILAYQKALRLRPNYAITHYYLGLSLERTGKKAEAKAAYQKAVELGTGELVRRAKSELRW